MRPDEASRFARADGSREAGGARMLSLRLTPEEWARLDEAVARTGLRRSEVVRKALAGRAIGTAVDQGILDGLQDARKLLRSLPDGQGHGMEADAVAEAYWLLSGDL